MEVTNVLIGIQARSTSARFPMKVHEKIGHKAMIEHVIASAEIAAKYINKYSNSTRTLVEVALLIPHGDLLSKYRSKLPVHEGPESDVLTRYAQAAARFKSDYVVRVTGDCPLIPSFLISKMIKTAVVNGYDYVSNVDPRFRTAADGHDCEAISIRLLKHLDETAKDPADREHVTLAARRSPPEWARLGHVTGHVDLSNLKLSVDSLEDLERVRAQYARINEMDHAAAETFGRHCVHKV